MLSSRKGQMNDRALIGSPETIRRRLKELEAIGVSEWNRRQAGNTVLLSLILYFLYSRIDAVITVIGCVFP
jgi:alkanesulfonate monooxygenase SsuD/methylene tetrahydromethanopterin reductase-like flavin-dependent oxidoreductase (luciferase family)